MPVKAVLFDLGGTLWAPYGSLGRDEVMYRAAVAAAKRLDPGIPAHQMETLARQLASSVAARLAGLRPGRDPLSTEGTVSGEDLREVDLSREFLESVRKLGVTVRPEDAESISAAFAFDLDRYYEVFPDVLPALSRLKAESPGLKIGIVSNTSLPEEVLDFHLAEAGIMGHTDFRVYSSTVGRRKPHPAIYARALELCGASAEDVVFVGDRLLEDVIGPKSMGMKAVWRKTVDVKDQGEPVWDDAVSDFSSLPEVIARLC